MNLLDDEILLHQTCILMESFYTSRFLDLNLLITSKLFNLF